MLTFSDMSRLTEEGERQLCSQLRKETFEIEEAHRRRAERAARIAELQACARRLFSPGSPAGHARPTRGA